MALSYQLFRHLYSKYIKKNTGQGISVMDHCSAIILTKTPWMSIKKYVLVKGDFNIKECLWNDPIYIKVPEL